MILNHSLLPKVFLKLSTLVLFLFAIVSCGSEPSKEKEIVELKPDSLIYDETGKPLTGKVRDKVGNKTIEYYVVDGKMHGRYRTYFTNEQVEMEGEIVNSKNEGIWKYYYPNGQLEAEGNFLNDKADSQWTWYYPSGVKRETAEYSSGKRNGIVVSYDTLGNVIEEKFFIDGVDKKAE